MAPYGPGCTGKINGTLIIRVSLPPFSHYSPFFLTSWKTSTSFFLTYRLKETHCCQVCSLDRNVIFRHLFEWHFSLYIRPWSNRPNRARVLGVTPFLPVVRSWR